MPILANIERRTIRGRMMVGLLFGLLTFGGLTMVYPFWLMVVGSTKSAVDIAENRILPRYLTEDEWLWRKHVEGLFNESIGVYREIHNTEAYSFRSVEQPPPPNDSLADLWEEYLRTQQPPDYTYTIGYLYCPVSRGSIPKNLRLMKNELRQQFGGSLEAFNRDYGTNFPGWHTVNPRSEYYVLRRERPLQTPLALKIRSFKATRPLDERYYFSVEGCFRDRFLKARYGRDVEQYNRYHGTNYAGYPDVPFPTRLPPWPAMTDEERSQLRRLGLSALRIVSLGVLPQQTSPREPIDLDVLKEYAGRLACTVRFRADWSEFVLDLLNPLWIRADPEVAGTYRAFLRAKYGTIQALNEKYETQYESFDAISLISEPPEGGLPLSDWHALLEGWDDGHNARFGIPAEKLRVASNETQFRNFLRTKYETIEALNQDVGTRYIDWLAVAPPQKDYQYRAFLRKRRELREEFTFRNFRAVIDYILLNGRGIMNTAIYCSLAVAGALLVNPLAAYALSRFRPPSSYKVLLFLMLTMAFPPMVAQIPVFLMLREFGLLNTFGALILPGLANGYSIFLLKGFFDSQPRELYESAQLDGAGEARIFWQITMSLSKPILAVIALNAFTLAYSNFMFALLICQDKDMWTLMVWLYELQRISDQGIVFASLVIAAVPVFLVFALCQKVIMRGIVVPVEK